MRLLLIDVGVVAWVGGTCRDDGDTQHTRASPHHIYRTRSRLQLEAAAAATTRPAKAGGGGGSLGGLELYPAATPERSFAAELLEQRYAGLMEGGEEALMSEEWLLDGMVHPTDPVLEQETTSGETGLGPQQGQDPTKDGLGRWPELAAEVRNAVRTFEAEHDSRTLRMYMADWVDHLIGRVLGVDEVPWFLLGLACPMEPCGVARLAAAADSGQ
jgi:hypothetical protein